MARQRCVVGLNIELEIILEAILLQEGYRRLGVIVVLEVVCFQW